MNDELRTDHHSVVPCFDSGRAKFSVRPFHPKTQEEAQTRFVCKIECRKPPIGAETSGVKKVKFEEYSSYEVTPE